MPPLLWPIVILLLGLALIVLEMFIPSGGVLGFLALSASVVAVGLAFYNGGLYAGTGFLAVTGLVVPLFIVLAVRWWPHTPIGRRMLNKPMDEDDVLPNDEETQRLRQLAGRRGVARSLMLPAGSIRVDGRTYDAVSDGVTIESGQTIEIILVEGNHIVVRPLDESPPAEPNPEGDDLLSQSLDSLGLDELEDPLA